MDDAGGLGGSETRAVMLRNGGRGGGTLRLENVADGLKRQYPVKSEGTCARYVRPASRIASLSFIYLILASASGPDSIPTPVTTPCRLSASFSTCLGRHPHALTTRDGVGVPGPGPSICGWHGMGWTGVARAG